MLITPLTSDALRDNPPAAFAKSGGRLLLVVDSIHRAGPKTSWEPDQKNELVECVVKGFQHKRLPRWCALLVTTQPNHMIRTALSLLQPPAVELVQGKRETALAAAELYGQGWTGVFQHQRSSIPANLTDDRDIVLAAVRSPQDHGRIPHIPPQFRGDREIVLEAARHDPAVLLQASAELRGDREILLTAINARDGRGISLLVHADMSQLGGDREFMRAVIQVHGNAFAYASAELRGDRELAWAALSRYGAPFKWASKDLRGDQDFALASVEHDATNGYGCVTLEHASAELRGNREFMLETIKYFGCIALRHASIAPSRGWFKYYELHAQTHNRARQCFK